MALQVERIEIWSGVIANEPGGLAAALAPLAAAGANLSYVLARRRGSNSESGVVYLAPIEGAAQRKAARHAGLERATRLFALRVEGADRSGSGSQIIARIADNGINLRGMSAISLGKKFVAYLALDSAADLKKTMKLLKNL